MNAFKSLLIGEVSFVLPSTELGTLFQLENFFSLLRITYLVNFCADLLDSNGNWEN